MGKRFDFTNAFAKLSTWAGILAGSAGVSLLAYAGMPERAQNLVPDIVLGVLAGLSVGVPFLNFVFTSFKQKNLGRANQVEIVKTVKVEGDVSPADATRIAEAVNDGSTGKA